MAYGHDPYGSAIGQGSGGTRQFVITPDDDNDLAVVVRAIRVTGAGDVSFIAFGDTVAVTWEDVAAGEIIPMYVKRVMESTTATGLIGLY
jgi:hypothetical protein